MGKNELLPAGVRYSAALTPTAFKCAQWAGAQWLSFEPPSWIKDVSWLPFVLLTLGLVVGQVVADIGNKHSSLMKFLHKAFGLFDVTGHHVELDGLFPGASVSLRFRRHAPKATILLHLMRGSEVITLVIFRNLHIAKGDEKRIALIEFGTLGENPHWKWNPDGEQSLLIMAELQYVIAIEVQNGSMSRQLYRLYIKIPASKDGADCVVISENQNIFDPNQIIPKVFWGNYLL